MPNRRTTLFQLLAGATALVSGCGTILYPDRVNQKERGNLDPAVVIMDGIGLFFFFVPGVVAFAVDFGTGAIFFPAGHDHGDREDTIFDKIDANAKPGRREIEDAVAARTGTHIDLLRNDTVVMELQTLEDFWDSYRMSARTALLATR